MAIAKEIAAKLKWVEEHFDLASGWPNGPDLYYKCLICGDFVCSFAYDECRCGNIDVDVGAGRVGAKGKQHVRLIRIKDPD